MNKSIKLMGFVAALLALVIGHYFLYTESSLIKVLSASDFQKESFLFSENGFYYSYFKRLVDGPSLLASLSSIVKDDVFTYPDQILAFRHFNIWQEFIAALIYITAGAGSPFNFYFLLTLTLHLSFLIVPFITGATDKKSWSQIPVYLLLLNTLFYISRAHGLPFLRENLGIPCFFLALLATMLYLAQGRRELLALAGAGALFHGIFWQFSVIPHALLNIILVVFTYIPHQELKERSHTLLKHQLWIWIAVTFLMAFNEFYLYSWNLSLLVCYFAAVKLKKSWVWICLPVIPLSLGGSFNHVVDIFKAKLLGIDNFHSLLYEAVPDFHSLNLYDYQEFTLNGFLPTIVLILISYKTYPKLIRWIVLIPLLFFIPFMMVKRLAFLGIFAWVGYLVVSLPYQKRIFSILITTLLSLSFLRQINSITKADPLHFSQEYYQGLVSFFKGIPEPAIIGSDFVLSANLNMHTKHKFILHPQYENHESRRRNELFNRAYAYFNPESISLWLNEFKIDYLVLDLRKCAGSDPFTDRIMRSLHQGAPKESILKFCDLALVDKDGPFVRQKTFGYYLILKKNQKSSPSPSGRSALPKKKDKYLI